MARTLYNPNNGRSFETELSDSVAAALCFQVQDARDKYLANSLADQFSRRRLSPAQLYWLHVLANRQLERAYQPYSVNESKIHVGDFLRLTRMFHYAQNYKPRGEDVVRRTVNLRIVFEYQPGKTLSISLASQTSRFPGQLWVGDGTYGRDSLYGRIDQQGNYHSLNSNKLLDEEALNFLRLFAQHPTQVAQEYGQKSGRCCFCGRRVQDESGDNNTQRGSSVEMGFGLVCARRYGMYHSKLTVQEKEDYVRREGSHDLLKD
jgi:hypothetical protein